MDSAAQNQASAHKHFTSCKAYSQLRCEECSRFQTPDPEVAIFIVFQEQCKTGRTNGENPLEMLISVISVESKLVKSPAKTLGKGFAHQTHVASMVSGQFIINPSRFKKMPRWYVYILTCTFTY